MGSSQVGPQLKSIASSNTWQYTTGNKLLYIGYSNGIESGTMDIPYMSKTITFQYATNIPCIGAQTVSYNGQVYNTIQVYSQCWIKENLNVGTMIDSNQIMNNDGVIQKYCQSNSPDSCARYGGLYPWDEVMQYISAEGGQGICPSGWHVPMDDDWKVLEGSVDSQNHLADSTWDLIGYRGLDAGIKLKSNRYWHGVPGTDLFGFSALPGGYEIQGGVFGITLYDGIWWTSTPNNQLSSFTHALTNSSNQIGHTPYPVTMSFSLRCLRDL
jgi:uncharacterized protein (TIGR02145 family)